MKYNSGIVKQAELILSDYRKSKKNKPINKITGSYIVPYLLIALSLVFFTLSASNLILWFIS
jgi:hypothetical protein